LGNDVEEPAVALSFPQTPVLCRPSVGARHRGQTIDQFKDFLRPGR